MDAKIERSREGNLSLDLEEDERAIKRRADDARAKMEAKAAKLQADRRAGKEESSLDLDLARKGLRAKSPNRAASPDSISQGRSHSPTSTGKGRPVSLKIDPTREKEKDSLFEADFDQVDRNNDGIIDRAEFSAHVQNNYRLPSPVPEIPQLPTSLAPEQDEKAKPNMGRRPSSGRAAMKELDEEYEVKTVQP